MNSFDYLYTREIDELVDHANTMGTSRALSAMRSRLLALGLSDVVADHDAFVELLEDLERRMDAAETPKARLAPIWEAIAKHTSGEIGDADLDEVLERYRRGR